MGGFNKCLLFNISGVEDPEITKSTESTNLVAICSQIGTEGALGKELFDEMVVWRMSLDVASNSSLWIWNSRIEASAESNRIKIEPNKTPCSDNFSHLLIHFSFFTLLVFFYITLRSEYLY